MKKLLVVLLALVMVFGLATNAFAYTDTYTLGASSQDAIAKLSALDIVGGYPDGTFGPDANITRAEFAKIAVNLAGLGDAADSLGDVSSRFSDVEAGAWYAGWVNLANAQGFVQGYPDGTFKPNANISMQEVVTVLLRIAGYDDNLVGPWPVDYIAKASALGVTDDVSFTATAKATRESVAVMSSNTLDQEVMYWDADKARFLSVGNNSNVPPTPITLLDESFNATVALNAFLGSWKVTDIDDMKFAVQVAGTYKDFADDFYITDFNTINVLNGKFGDVYYNADGEIIFVDVTSYAIVTDDADLSGASTLSINGDSASTIAGYTHAANAAGVVIGNDQNVIVFYNEDDEIYLLAPASTNINAIVVDEYDASAQRIKTLYGSAPTVKDKDVVVIKNAALASLEDLASGDVFYRDNTVTGIDEFIWVFPTQEGELTAGNATKLTISGLKLTYAGAQYTDDEFDSTAAVGLAALDDAFGTSVKYVTAFCNPFKLAVMSIGASEDTSTVYGVITSASGNISGKVTSLTILNQDGEEVTYDLVDGDTTALPVWGFGAGKIEAGSYIEAKVSADGTIDTDNITRMTNTTALAVGPVAADYAALNGVGSYVAAAGPAVTVVDDRVLLAGKYYTVTDDTNAFNVTLAAGVFDEADVVAPADITDASNIASTAYAAKVADGEVVSIIFLSSTLTSSSNYGVLTDATYKSGDWYVTVDGVEYEADKDYSAVGSNFVDNDFVEYTLTDGKVSNATSVFTQTAADTYTVLDDSSAFTAGNAWVDANGTATNDGTVPTAPITLVSKSGNNLALGTAGNDTTLYRNFIVDSDTVYYEIEADGDIVEADLGAFSAGDVVFAVTTDDLADWTIAYLFLVDASTDLLADSSTTLADTTLTATVAVPNPTTTFTVTAPATANITVVSSAPGVATALPAAPASGAAVTITYVAAGTTTITVTITDTANPTWVAPVVYTAVVTCN